MCRIAHNEYYVKSYGNLGRMDRFPASQNQTHVTNTSVSRVLHAPSTQSTRHAPKKNQKKSDFAQFRGKFFLSIPKAAELFGVTERTVRNWDRDGAPAMAMKLAAVYRRDLSGYHPDWKGFTIGVNGKLYGPNKVQLSAEHIRHWRACVRCTSWDTEGCALVKPKPDKE
jgi:DNA-binding transcriptional regulator YiaG